MSCGRFEECAEQLAFEMAAPAPAHTPSLGAQLAISLQKNRELTIKLYTMRNEPPPDDAACAPPRRSPAAKCDARVGWPMRASAAPACARPRSVSPRSQLHRTPPHFERRKNATSDIRSCASQERPLLRARAGARLATKGVGGVRGPLWHRLPLLRPVQAHAQRWLLHLMRADAVHMLTCSCSYSPGCAS